MSYITDDLLTKEVRRLFAEMGKDPERIHIWDRDLERPRHPFMLNIDGVDVKFTIPEDELHSAPLRFVSDRHLRPLLDRHAGDPS